MRLLNVGGGSRDLPPHYDGVRQQVLLDVDASVNPDICADALGLVDMELEPFDTVYCSHTLEHFYRHDVPMVLAGFKKALKPGGVVEIIVPNLEHLMKAMLSAKLEPTDTYYRAGFLPISFHDVLYGWNEKMKEGNLFYAHRCGFTAATLWAALDAAGFVDIQLMDGAYNLRALAKKA